MPACKDTLFSLATVPIASGRISRRARGGEGKGGGAAWCYSFPNRVRKYQTFYVSLRTVSAINFLEKKHRGGKMENLSNDDTVMVCEC